MDSQVTVIIPCLNVEDYIDDCLNSVLSQGSAVAEIFVVDNGSTDTTLARIDAWQSAHPERRVHLIQEQNPGAPAARNAPLQDVKTEWIQFLDADDLLLPGKLLRQLEWAGPDVDVLVDSYITLNGNRDKATKIETAREVEVGLMRSSLGITSSNLWRTASIKRVNGWDVTRTSSQEYDLMLRLYQQGARFQFVDTARTLIQGRTHGQISQSDPLNRWRNFVEIRKKILLSLDFSGLSTESQQQAFEGLFFGLRMLYPVDPATSLRVHRELLSPRRFRPQPSTHTTRWYCLAYRWTGFAGVERLKRFVKGN
jgi:glycosyltransferase involved in cell wall biosynthesis